MKKSVFKKLLFFVLTMALLIGAVVTIAAAADSESTYEIKAVNISYGDRFNVLIAVDAPISEAEDIEVKYYIGNVEYPAEYWDTYTNSPENTTKCPVFYTGGIAAKDCGETIRIEAHKVGATDYEPKYKETSVASYLAKKLYADGYAAKNEISDRIKETDVERRNLYADCLEYIASAQEVLWNYVYVNNQRQLVTDRLFVGVEKGYVLSGGSNFGELDKDSATVTIVNAAGNEKTPDGWYAHYFDGSVELFKATSFEIEAACHLTPYFDGLIYDETITPTVVYDKSVLSYVSDEVLTAYNAIDSKVTSTAYLKYDTSKVARHEIVIGDTTRAITAIAKNILIDKVKNARKDAEDESIDSGYLIYSDGESVAVVWTDFQLAPEAIKAFLTYVTEDGTLKFDMSGGEFTSSKCYSLNDYLKNREEKILEAEWAKLAEVLATKTENAAAIVKALQDYYAMTDYDAAIEWIASLYDPDIGGWHRSPSGRDNIGFLPNIESTLYGLNIFGSAGEIVGTSMSKAVPKEILTRAARWIQSLQDPDGYFYHPQWPKEYIEANNLGLRITRDRGSAKTILNNAGISAIYSGYAMSGSYLLGNLGTSTVVAASKVIAVSEEVSSNKLDITDAIKSVEKFKEYIAQCEADIENIPNLIAEKLEKDKDKYKDYTAEQLEVLRATLEDKQKASYFYTWGSYCQSVAGSIKASPEMKKAAIDFFNRHQNDKNGVWSNAIYFNSSNAIHKISSVYTSLGEELKHTDEMVATNLQILSWVHSGDSEGTKPGNTCDIYNIWSNFGYIYENIRKCGSGTDEAKEARVDAILALVYEGAVDAIVASMQEAEEYKAYVLNENKEKIYIDGAYNTTKDRSAYDAYGCLTGLAGQTDGDLDGFLFAAIDIPRHIFAALDLSDYEVSYFTEHDRVVYTNAILNAESIVKKDVSDTITTYNFENETVNEVPEGVTVNVASDKNQNADTYIKVNEVSGNKVLAFQANAQSESDILTDKGRNPNAAIKATHLNSMPTVAYLSMKIKINSTNTSHGTFSILLAHSETPIQASIRKNGTDIYFHETNGNSLGKVGTMNEWFEIAIIYDWGAGEYAVYTVDSNGDKKLVGIGTSTLSTSSGAPVAHQLVSRVTLGSDSNVVANYYIDDITFYTYNNTKAN